MGRLTIFYSLVISFTFCLSSIGFSQPKYEREIRIARKRVPEKALQFIDSMNFNSRVRWYQEIGYDQITYEAKTRYRRERFSIEFCDMGKLQDIEIEINPKRIPTTAYTSINVHLHAKYGSFKFEKIQIQYSGDEQQVLAFFKNNRESPEGLKILYEIVISTKIDGSFKFFEYLFSHSGDYIQSRQIIQRRTDNIEY